MGAALHRERVRWLVLPRPLVLGSGQAAEQLVVRGARRPDADALVLLVGRSTRTVAVGAPSWALGSPESVRRALSTELPLLAERGRRVVALGTLSAGPDRSARLDLLVEDPYRGRGLGTALTDHLCAAAWLLGYRAVRVGRNPVVALGPECLGALLGPGTGGDGVEPSSRALERRSSRRRRGVPA